MEFARTRRLSVEALVSVFTVRRTALAIAQLRRGRYRLSRLGRSAQILTVVPHRSVARDPTMSSARRGPCGDR